MLTINLLKHTNYSGQRLVVLNQSLNIITQVLNNYEFDNSVRDFITNGQKTFSYRKNAFKHFEQYTNEEVLHIIKQASEEDGNTADGQIDLYLELVEKDDNTVVGYSYPGDVTIYTYSGWFDSNDKYSIANHITHEWCHKIGFEHAFYAWQDKYRDNSVPYGIGNLVEQISRNLNL